jgi:GTP-binding protein YchF
MDIVDFELQVRDLDLISRKIERLKKLVSVGDVEAKKILKVMEVYKNHLENFGNARTAPVSEEETEYIKEMQLLTAKPVIYVCNVDDSSAVKGNQYSEQVMKHLGNEGSHVLIIAGELEAEISELDASDRDDFLSDAGLTEPGVNKLVRAAYDILNLQSFFTAGPKEVKAWTIKKGMKAPEAAGAIHSDIERGFIRAEVMKYEDFIQYGSEVAVKNAGKFHVEGKNYVVEDGDIMHFRFNV